LQCSAGLGRLSALCCVHDGSLGHSVLPIISLRLVGEQRRSGPQPSFDLESDSSQQPCTLHGQPAYPYTLSSVRRPVPPPLLRLPVVTEYIPSLSNKTRLRVSCELWFQVSYVETLLQTHVLSHCSVQNFRLSSGQVELKLLCSLDTRRKVCHRRSRRLVNLLERIC